MGPDTTLYAPMPLPDEHGFRHALGAEDHSAVAKQYPPAPARDDRTMVRTVYHNGRKRRLQAKGAEFEFQLDGQYQVLAQMPAKYYLAARDLFRQQGRQGNEATRRAREQLRNRLAEYGRDRLDMSSAASRAWAREAMRQVAILHNPDQVLGGDLSPSRDAGGIPIPGDRGVNSSLGAQNLSNAAVIDAAAERQVAAGNGHLPLSFQVVLTNRRRNVERLRARQPPPPLQLAQPSTQHDEQTPTKTLSKAVLAARPPPQADRNPTTAARIRQTLGIHTPTYTPPHRNRPGPYTTRDNTPER
ncbi:polymorphic toxin type 15 domain-containing protein [Actinomyces qiguomingii]|uniref:polymorphic toxin type 15 domain-containing protein n=1 Tax=Actinomyces qiguomingii TaxID=2057800 RepID=UPI000CA02D88|nr:polymorphic toxin type 15 domain-containing protein [Actinomyces qiguomingii]